MSERVPVRLFARLQAAGLAALLLLGAALRAEDLPPADPAADFTPEIIKEDTPDLDRVKAHVEKLTSFGSRLAGSPGNLQAKAYIVDQLKALGFQDGTGATPAESDEKTGTKPNWIGTQRFWGSAPDAAKTGELAITTEGGGKEIFPVYGVWPNGAAFTTTRGMSEIKGRLIYGRNGRIENFDQPGEGASPEAKRAWHDVVGAWVLIDLNAQTKWTYAATLGAKGVIFIEPEKTINPLVERMKCSTPVEFPRLWVTREVGEALKARILAGETLDAEPKVHVAWKSDIWENVYVLVPGDGRFYGQIENPDKLAEKLKGLKLSGADATVRDALSALLLSRRVLFSDLKKALEDCAGLPDMKDAITGALEDLEKRVKNEQQTTLVLSAYFDSNSEVPGLAPGAEASLGCATLLDLARQYRQRPPPRDTLLVFFNGHFQGLKGEREFFAEATEMPEAVSDDKLWGALGRARTSLQMLDNSVGADKPFPAHEGLVQAMAKADAEFRGSEEGARALKAAEAAKQTEISLPGVLASVLLLVFGICMFVFCRKGTTEASENPTAGEIATAINRKRSDDLRRRIEMVVGGVVVAIAGFGYYTVVADQTGNKFTPIWLWPVAFAALGLMVQALRGGARIAMGIGMLGGALVLSLYAVGLPLIKPHFQKSTTDLTPEARLDQALTQWKEDLATLENDRERKLRVMRSEGEKRDSAPYQQLEAEQKSYDEAGQYLYTLTQSGRTLAPPPNPERLKSQIDEAGASLKGRLGDELEWCRLEAARRDWNAPFRTLVRNRLSEQSEKDNGQRSFFVGLDFSSGYPGLGVIYKGAFFMQPGDVDSKFQEFGRAVTPLMRGVEKTLGQERGVAFIDSLQQSEQNNRLWFTYWPVPVAHSAEIAVQAQIRGVSLVTPIDRRLAWDTPADQTALINWNNVETQLRLAGPFLRRFAAQADTFVSSRVKPTMTGYAQMIFKAIRPGGSRSIFPTVPVSKAWVGNVVDASSVYGMSSCAGVRMNMVEISNPLGLVRLTGILHKNGPHAFEVYAHNSQTGEINYTLNMNKKGLDEVKSFESTVGNLDRVLDLELFRAQGLAVLDIEDPGRLVVLRSYSLLGGQSEAKPLEYGTSPNYWRESHRVFFAEPSSRVKCLFREGQFGLRMAVLNVDEKVTEKLLQGKAKEVRETEARGPGFRLGTTKVLQWTPFRVAMDMWSLGEYRLQDLREHSISNARLDNPQFPGPYSRGKVFPVKGSKFVKGSADVKWDDGAIGMPFRIKGAPGLYEVRNVKGPQELELDRPFVFDVDAGEKGADFLLTREDPGLHNLTYERLLDARAALEHKQYSAAWRLSTDAWSLEARAYPEVLGTANDSVLGVVFYLFLLLPFCYFLERLLFAFPKIEKQILAFFAIFLAMFVLLWLVHPAFTLVKAPAVILLAFVIMTLALVVIMIVYGKFNTEMHLMQAGVKGVQSADINRAGAGFVAVSLGISQMRRRKFRTALTCITVILLTFTALSFTSTVNTIAQASVDLSPGNEKDAAYQGILVRQFNYNPLNPGTYEQLFRELATKGYRPAPRYWVVSPPNANAIMVDVFSEDQKTQVTPGAILGVSPEELVILPKLKKSLLAGRWIKYADEASGTLERDECLLPNDLARRLIGAPNMSWSSRLLEMAGHKDPLWKPEKALDKKIRVGSYTLTVVGVYDSDAFNDVRDLDNESILPVNFKASEDNRAGSAPTGDSVGTEQLQSAKTARFEHLSSAECIVMPWTTAALLGADLRSIAVRIDDLDTLVFFTDRVLKGLEKNLFVGKEGRRQLFASQGRIGLTGLGNLIVPLLISVLILLNTMIGAVYERNKEIGIFSSLGLAPSHIASLFLAEALVYATLGAILGYLLGQGVAKAVQVLGVSGLYLNYSSSSAVFVTLVVMGAVLSSTIVPAILAARTASPREERKVGIPSPVGDEISLELPFSFQRELVPGVALFLHDYFASHAESSLGGFTAKEVTLEAFHTEHGQGICLFFMGWLTPYDLGVSQEVQVYIVPAEEGLYVTEASFYRVSGYVTSWQRVNHPFLNTLRKQFLVWRTYSPAQRQEFAVRGYYQFQEAFEAVGWPPPKGVQELKPAEEHDLTDEGELETPGTQAPAPA